LSDDNLKNFLTPTVKKLQQEAKKSLECCHTEWPKPMAKTFLSKLFLSITVKTFYRTRPITGIECNLVKSKEPKMFLYINRKNLCVRPTSG